MNGLMKRTFCRIAVLALATSALHAEAPQSQTSRAVASANTFIGTLDQKQKDSLLFKYDDEAQRARWSNLPTMAVRRAGLKVGDLSAEQRAAAMSFLQTLLSKSGYEKVLGIMQGDELLKGTDGGRGRGGPPGGGPGRGGPPDGGPDGRGRDGRGPGGGPDGGGPGGRGPGDGGPGGRGPRGGGPGGGGGGGAMFGKDLYFISILGTPSEKEPWMVQFGGHHLGLNITITGEKGTLAPSHAGSQPALFQFDGKTVRPLGQEGDKALALLNALDDAQKKKAILNYRVADLVLGPGKDGKTIQPEGLKGSDMTDKQRDMLLDLVSEWVDIASDDYAKPRLAEIKNDLSETWFAWSGPTTAEPGKNATGYFRVQGPKVLIEYAPQRLGGDLALHIHTIYRDPTNDYGRGTKSK